MAAAQQRAQAGEQFAKVERLGQVVVGAAVEAVHARFNGVPCGEHEDRDLQPRVAQLAADGEAILPRQADVEDDGVELRDGRVVDRLFAVRRDVDGVRLLAQSFCQDLRGAWFILDQ